MFEMVEENKLGIGFKGFYCPIINKRIKRIEGAKFLDKGNLWEVPLEKKEKLIRTIGKKCI